MARPVLLVHGAWHGGWSWAMLQAELDRRGVPSWAIDLPGHGTSTEHMGDLHADARAVATASNHLATRHRDAAADEGGDLDDAPARVVLVGHSYGGAVISQAARWTNTISDLVYVAAFVLEVGESMNKIAVLDGVPEEPPSLIGHARRRDGDVLRLDPIEAVPALYGSAPAEVQHAAAARIEPQPITSFTQAVVEGQHQLSASPRASYVRCTDDMCVPLSHQDAMAARCTSVHTLHTDHCPMFSAPTHLADIIAHIARA